MHPALEDWRIRLRRDGCAHFRGLYPEPIVAAARVAIDHDLSTNYDPRREVEYDNRSYCPGPSRTPSNHGAIAG